MEEEQAEAEEVKNPAQETSAEIRSHCYCGTEELDVHSMIPCEICKRCFHQDCFKTGRFSTLLGDRFISFTCADCSEDGEKVSRKPLTWFSAVCLAFYNLHESGAENRAGYFQWREQMCRFIEEHWLEIFPDRKKPPKWHGAVACALSNNTGVFFQSGAGELGEAGWWKLINNVPPDPNVTISQKNKKRRVPTEHLTPLVELGPRVRKRVIPDSVYQRTTSVSHKEASSPRTSESAMVECPPKAPASGTPASSYTEPAPVDTAETKCPTEAKSEQQDEELPPEPAKVPVRVVPLSTFEEEQLLEHLSEAFSALRGPPLSPKLMRLLTKLRVRKAKRDQGIGVFNLDGECARLLGRSPASDLEHEVLDRFVHTNVVSDGGPSLHGRTNFATKLLGSQRNDVYNYENFRSPYTQRTLKPFIFRDTNADYPRVQLLKEICAHRLCLAGSNREKYTVKPVDFVYVRPHHIAVVNSICRSFFWAGIDLSGQLQYPEFSIVALYGKIVIGFAFMVPLQRSNEAYLTFLWTHPHFRRRGLARFMLYHLTQSCMGRDITLHVSASNPAAFLYQNFKFRIEKLCLNFYERYLPATSNECRHALQMRLKW